jgi:hypothetical protein
LICEQWFRQAFDAGLVATDLRAHDIVVQSRSKIGVDEGAFADVPFEARQNLLKYLVAVAVDQPRKALDCLLKEFEATGHRTPLEILDRHFRQLTPDAYEADSHGSSAGDVVSTVQAQWRLAIENGYRPTRRVLPVLRGVMRLNETVHRVWPGTDALLEGLKDYRLTRLLGDVHTMCEPMHWFGQLDKAVTLFVSSPRILDDAIAAVVPDRAAAERNAPPARYRRGTGAAWFVPALAALAVVGLGFGRGPPGGTGSREEIFAAVLFLLLGGWLLRSSGERDR